MIHPCPWVRVASMSHVKVRMYQLLGVCEDTTTHSNTTRPDAYVPRLKNDSLCVALHPMHNKTLFNVI
jgi:hypothetical protein